MKTRKWLSESADPPKALGRSDILDRNPVVDTSDCLSFLCPCVHTEIKTTISMFMLWQCTAVVQTGDSGDQDSVLNPRCPRNFIIVPRIRTVTKYKNEKISVVTGDRTDNLHLPRLAYIPLVQPCASHRRNKLYKCMNHHCIERLAIFSHYQNPTSSS